jgi:apolipoprotein N-acyltransferase
MVTGLAFAAPTLWWLRPVGIGAWLALCVLTALFTGLTGPAVARTQRRWPRFWPVPAALCWVVAESIRSRVPFGGFPWARLAFSQANGPVLRWAAIGGAPLVSAAVAVAGTALAAGVLALVRSRPRRSAAGWAVVVAAVPVAALAVPVPTGGQPDSTGRASLTVAAVQGNVPRLGLDFDSQREAVLNLHVQATERLAARVAAGTMPQPDLVVLPENSTDLDPLLDTEVAAKFDAAAKAVKAPMLIGAVLEGPGPDHVRNAGLVWNAGGYAGVLYVKRQLVPFGEYVPFRAQLSGLITSLNRIPRDFAPGHATGAIPVGPVRIGDVICYEVAYDGLVRDDVRHGARLLVVQTNNATFGPAEASQQLAMVRLRAVEHGRAAVMASTSGISALVAPDGTVLQKTGRFVQAEIEASLPERGSTTVADRLGGLVELLLVGLGLLLTVTPRRHSVGARRRQLALRWGS